MSQKPIHTDRPFMQRASNCHLLTESPTNSDLHKNFPFLFSPTNQTPKSSIPHLISERATDATQNSKKRNCKPHQDCKTHHTCKGLQSSPKLWEWLQSAPKLSKFCKVSAKLFKFLAKFAKKIWEYIFW